MNLLEKLQFGFTYSTSAGTTAAWIWAILITLVFFFGFGMVWGKLWNKSWSLTDSGMRVTLVAVASILAGYATLNLANVQKFDQWLENERAQLVRSVTSSGKFNRDVFVDAWEIISANSDQKGLTHPDEGGEELRLNEKTDASHLASASASEASAVLRKKAPFIWGVPFSPMLPEVAAASTIEAVGLPDSEYPAIVLANNDWTRTAATIQANHSLEAFRKIVGPEIESLRMGCTGLIGLLAALLIFFIPSIALGEIQVNPKA
ncbi:hypothetical protein [Rubritalea profundi]|uniref:Uncharacterized protein n=1 Tax=Rubritalea profundi TaxID=1658618 RepID=A0A2S7TXG9_9BACT|nr:hypothetical protein [Rubritalea profundi]PQJ27428.1 hypothetical protein BSZ32_02235 [Rubritalea profundi]